MTDASVLDIEAILEKLPHRYPFLLVDRVLEYEEKVRGVGIKNVTVNEPFFQGHFPELRVMPGVLIVEALAQLTGIVTHALSEDGTRLGFFAAINSARFRQPVVPGDQLRLEINISKIKSGVAKVTGQASVDGKSVCDAELTLTYK